MSYGWPTVTYEQWSGTCDTLHAHTQVLGKLAAALAPPEPQLQHSALRLSGRGWGALPVPAAGGAGSRCRSRHRTAPAPWSSRWTCMVTTRWLSTATVERTTCPLGRTGR